MTRITFWHPAGTYEIPGKGEFLQKFAPHAFDGAVGQQVPVKDQPGGQVLGTGILIAAEVDADGGGVTMTFDMPGDGLPGGAGPLSPAIHGMSFAFREPEALPRDVLAGELKIQWACSGRPEDPGKLRLADSKRPYRPPPRGAGNS